MTLDLTDEQTDALERLLTATIDGDRYPFSPRIATLKGILAKLQRPKPKPAPPPPLPHYAPPRAKPAQRRVRR